MRQVQFVRLLVAFASAAMLLACGPLAAQVSSPGNNKPLPPSAQKAPPFQGGGSVDLGPVLARIEALEGKVSKLEGNLTQADLVGTYRWGYLQVSIGEDASGTANHLEHNVVGGTLTLSSGGAASFSGRELGFATGLPGPSSRQERVNNSDEFTATWTYTGGVLVLTVTGDDGQPENVNFVGGVGGRMFFTATANPLDGTTTLIILSKNL
jgi:hypothetical protein